MSEEKWRTIKVKKETYEQLKKMGVGIGRAVDLLVRLQKKKLERKIEDIREAASEIADILVEHGLFSIRVGSCGIESVEVEGDQVYVKGYANLIIPDEEVRNKIIEILRGE